MKTEPTDPTAEDIRYAAQLAAADVAELDRRNRHAASLGMALVCVLAPAVALVTYTLIQGFWKGTPMVIWGFSSLAFGVTGLWWAATAAVGPTLPARTQAYVGLATDPKAELQYRRDQLDSLNGSLKGRHYNLRWCLCLIGAYCTLTPVLLMLL